MTGSGTITDPYLVGNKAELKQAMETERSSGSPIYIKLTNTINLRWGTGWKKITTSAGTDPVDVDLDGYSIKNMYLKTGVFDLKNADKIHNGKIINLVTASDFAEEYVFNGGVFENISANFTADVPVGAVFNNSQLIKTALSLKYSTGTADSVLNAIKLRAASGQSDTNQIDESDIKIIIAEFDAPDGELIKPPASGTACIKSSRITGEITSFKNASATYYPIVSTATLKNCVVEFKVPTYTGSGSPTAPHNFVTGDTNDISVVNTYNGILPYNGNTSIYSLGSGCTGVTTNDIRSQYLLWPKFFEVYQIQKAVSE